MSGTTPGRRRIAVARACLNLARCLATRREVAQRPWVDSLARSPFQEFLAGRMDPSYFDIVREADPVALFREAEGLFERVIAEYGDIPAMLSNGTIVEGRDQTDVAASDLFELRHLSIGSVAPEIEGQDLDGELMRLSDHRGKVVALVAWATGCGPCMGMVSHEQELVERLEGEPFVLLGINGDDHPERVREVMREEGITWRSWWDGGPSGLITTQWNIRGWPTVYVLDDEGVIRYKQVRGERLDEAVDTLLAEMAAEATVEP